ncbi:unnamed protein product [Linum trigynum]|uniref:Transmembrane protein n=2 Tax=Linum trigynum TaxID=586398 RepID=A0AAV2E3K2_9ROSI
MNEMLSATSLQVSNSPLPIRNSSHSFSATPLLRRRPIRLLSVRSHFGVSAAKQPSISSRYTESVGSPAMAPPTPVIQFNFSQRHALLLNVFACSAAVSATWLFLSAIPTLLAFKRAAESLEKLMDVTREELPNTMAAIRLSGMEISDLTMELSDLGQEITHGVKNSTKAVRVAEEKLRGLTNVAAAPPVQRVASLATRNEAPAVARTARGLKEGIVKGRSLFQLFLTLTSFTRLALSYFAKRAKKRTLSSN